MSSKILEISFPEKCIGCELCIQEAQRQIGKIGLDEAPIRIFNSNKTTNLTNTPTYEIVINKDINKLDIEKIESILVSAALEI